MHDNSGFTVLDYIKRGNIQDPFRPYEFTYWDYLFRAEILADWFNLAADDSVRHVYGKVHAFKGDNKAQASLSRSLKNLADKGYIRVVLSTYEQRQGVQLTDKGISMAERLKLTDEQQT